MPSLSGVPDEYGASCREPAGEHLNPWAQCGGKSGPEIGRASDIRCRRCLLPESVQDRKTEPQSSEERKMFAQCGGITCSQSRRDRRRASGSADPGCGTEQTLSTDTELRNKDADSCGPFV